jgi:hypothetical protein
MEQAARAVGQNLADYVDDVVFTTGPAPWFNVINGRRTVAISQNVLRKSDAGRLIAAIHELTHARHAAKLGIDTYRAIYAADRARIEVLVELRAMRTAERYLGALSRQQRADSMRYIQRWLEHEE